MKLSGFIVVAVFAALTFGLWAYFNQPVSEPPWPDRVQGVAFSPFRAGQDPAVQSLPSDAEIAADLGLLADRVTAVRTYSALKSLGQTAALAERHGMKVTQGVWLDTQLATNEREIAAAIELAKRHSNIIRVIVGNEVLLRGNLSIGQLAGHLERVRAEIDQPVSTAEPWHVWLKHPELAEHVDFIAVHLLPYWEAWRSSSRWRTSLSTCASCRLHSRASRS
jgi:exo-beta-1,3-glucanase (GH17 family)